MSKSPTPAKKDRRTWSFTDHVCKACGGRDAAEAAAEFFGVPLKTVAEWEERYEMGVSTGYYPAQEQRAC